MVKHAKVPYFRHAPVSQFSDITPVIRGVHPPNTPILGKIRKKGDDK